MALIIYLLCAVTSFACAFLLFRGYRRTRVKLLLWSGLCFTGFFINNVILIIDLRLLPEQDLSVIRSLPLLAGISCLLYGLTAEKR
ncbi:MAG: DUF5985 family protein [Gemmatimonadaceae bacterium]